LTHGVLLTAGHAEHAVVHCVVATFESVGHLPVKRLFFIVRNSFLPLPSLFTGGAGAEKDGIHPQNDSVGEAMRAALLLRCGCWNPRRGCWGRGWGELGAHRAHMCCLAHGVRVGIACTPAPLSRDARPTGCTQGARKHYCINKRVANSDDVNARCEVSTAAAASERAPSLGRPPRPDGSSSSSCCRLGPMAAGHGPQAAPPHLGPRPSLPAPRGRRLQELMRDQMGCSYHKNAKTLTHGLVQVRGWWQRPCSGQDCPGSPPPPPPGPSAGSAPPAGTSSTCAGGCSTEVWGATRGAGHLAHSRLLLAVAVAHPGAGA